MPLNKIKGLQSFQYEILLLADNWGDVKHLQEGVWEMREFFGPGWRMYYIKHGDVIIVMLGGGDKSTQQKDIERAVDLSKSLED